MKAVPDRKRLRREYLRKNTKATLRAIIVSLILPAGAVIGGYGLGYLVCHGLIPRGYALPGFVMLLAFILGTTMLYIRRVKALETWRRTHYVPPVTSATLPAEEVLVRGAEEPSAPKETLLRAAATGEETKAAELLRSHLS